MRELNEAQLAALTNEVGSKHCLRVKVADSDGNLVDLRTLWELDWTLGAEWHSNLDTETGIATVRVTRKHHEGSLAPLMSDSTFNLLTGAYSALLAPGRLVTIEVALVGRDDGPERPTLPNADDWAEVFRGRIDEVETAAGESDIALQCRDLAGVIFDRFIEEERDYGSEDGTPLESVIQSMLTDNGIAVTLYCPVSPAWDLSTYTQMRMSLGQAIGALTAQIGWDCRYKWDEATGTWRYTLYEPQRGKTVADWSLTGDDYRAIQSFAQAQYDVRTRWSVTYRDITDKDATGKPKRKKVEVVNTALEEELGSPSEPYVKWAHISAALNVDTPEEAQRLADVALEDTGYVPTVATLVMDLAWHFDVGDLIELVANGETHDTDIALAVEDLKHSMTERKATTTVTLRGKPGMSYRRWGQYSGRGTTPPSPFLAPFAPVNLSTTPTVNGVALAFQRNAYGTPPASFELHISTNPDFEPDTDDGSATFVKASDSTRFDIADLAPGATYYARVVPRDERGTLGPASEAVEVTTLPVQPRHLQTRIHFGSLPRNADFEAHSDTSVAPDGWEFRGTGLDFGNTAWGIDANVTTDTYAGSRAFRFEDVAKNVAIVADLFTVREGEQWVFSVWFKSSVGGASAGGISASWIGSDNATISADNAWLGSSSLVAGAWTRAVFKANVPAGARYASVVVSRSSTNSGALTIDSVDALRTVAYEPWKSVTFTTDFQNLSAGIYGGVSYRKNDLGEVEFMGVAKALASLTNATMFTMPVGYIPGTRRLYRLGSTDVEVRPDGSVRVVSIAADGTVPMDVVRYQSEF